jgi:hypothetical protein
VLVLVGEVLEKHRYWLNNQSILLNQEFWFSCFLHSLTLWRRNFLLNFSTPCI